jgi:hypothetical protein
VKADRNSLLRVSNAGPTAEHALRFNIAYIDVLFKQIFLGRIIYEDRSP